MRNNLLEELKELDGTIARLEDRRGDVINMLDTLSALIALDQSGEIGERSQTSHSRARAATSRLDIVKLKPR